MNITDIKATWLEYDKKLQETQTLNQKLITSMISERSRSRVAGIQRQFAGTAALTFFWLTVIIAILLGNPFDYTRAIEYAPVVLLALSFISILILTGTASTALRKVNINQTSLAGSINEIIRVYHKPDRFLKMTVIAMFSAGLMFPLSFLPRKIEKVGVGTAVIDTIIPMTISLLLYFAAVKLGAFKQKHIEGLKGDLDELAELKALSNDLTNT